MADRNSRWAVSRLLVFSQDAEANLGVVLSKQQHNNTLQMTEKQIHDMTKQCLELMARRSVI